MLEIIHKLNRDISFVNASRFVGRDVALLFLLQCLKCFYLLADDYLTFWLSYPVPHKNILDVNYRIRILVAEHPPLLINNKIRAETIPRI